MGYLKGFCSDDLNMVLWSWKCRATHCIHYPRLLAKNKMTIISRAHLSDLGMLLTLFPTIKINSKDWEFDTLWHSGRIEDGANQLHKKELQENFAFAEKALGMYTLARKLLKILVVNKIQICVVLFIDVLCKFFGSSL